MKPEVVRQALVVNEDELQEQQLGRIAEHLSLGTEGQVYLRNPSRHTQAQQILLYLLGAKCGVLAKLRERDVLNLQEMSNMTGLDVNALTRRLSELKDERKVENVGRGEYRIIFARLAPLLDELEGNARRE